LNGPYLPASALKGALRSGLVFTRWSAATMERAAFSMEGDRVPRRIAEAAEANAGASQMKIVSIADGQPVAGTSFKVYLTRVASLDTRQVGKPQLTWKVAGRGSVPPQRVSDSTPVFVEMAVPGAIFSGSWDERTFFENQDLLHALGWRSTPEVRTITDAANQYASAQLNLHSQFADASGLTVLQNGIKRLKEELESAQNSTFTCLLSLGWGGGFVSKSAFLDTNLDHYRKILRSIPAIAKGIRENVPFPKTRRVIFTGGQPAAIPGWIKLELQK
jgi:CRISPR-associated protein Csm5